jgi:hypothetical protein
VPHQGRATMHHRPHVGALACLSLQPTVAERERGGVVWIRARGDKNLVVLGRKIRDERDNESM